MDIKNSIDEDENGEERIWLIKNVSLFVIERYHLLIRIKSILLFNELFFFYLS